MVKGFMIQLTTKVIHNPLGLFPTFLIDAKSTLTIMGYIITQMNKATMRLTLAYSIVAIVSNIDGRTRPNPTPDAIQSPTHTERYFSNNAIAVDSSFYRECITYVDIINILKQNS